MAAGKGDSQDANSRYQRDRALCASRAQEDRPSCLKEAIAARAIAQRHHTDETPEQLMRNALRRCEALQGPDRQDCVSRVQGLGTASGSVAGGGIYRELVTREPVVPNQARP